MCLLLALPQTTREQSEGPVHTHTVYTFSGMGADQAAVGAGVTPAHGSSRAEAARSMAKRKTTPLVHPKPVPATNTHTHTKKNAVVNALRSRSAPCPAQRHGTRTLLHGVLAAVAGNTDASHVVLFKHVASVFGAGGQPAAVRALKPGSAQRVCRRVR